MRDRSLQYSMNYTQIRKVMKKVLTFLCLSCISFSVSVSAEPNDNKGHYNRPPPVTHRGGGGATPGRAISPPRAAISSRIYTSPAAPITRSQRAPVIQQSIPQTSRNRTRDDRHYRGYRGYRGGEAVTTIVTPGPYIAPDYYYTNPYVTTPEDNSLYYEDEGNLTVDSFVDGNGQTIYYYTDEAGNEVYYTLDAEGAPVYLAE